MYVRWFADSDAVAYVERLSPFRCVSPYLVVAAVISVGCAESSGAEPHLLAIPEILDLSLQLNEVAIEGEPRAVTELAFVPGASELLLLNQTGKVTRYELQNGNLRLIDEVQLSDVAGYDDCGLVSVAFDPDFASNGFVYFGHCKTRQSKRTRRTWPATEASCCV